MDSTITITMESALRAAISAAFKTLDGKTYPQDGPKDMLDMILDDVFAVLFPRPAAVEHEFLTLPASPVSEEPKVGEKRKADKMSGAGEKKKKEPKTRLIDVAEPAEAVEPKPEPEKKKRGPKPKASLEQLTEAMAGLTVAEPAPEPEKKKSRKKKEPTPGDVEKLNPTETRKLKEISTELNVPADKKEFIAYLNTMTAEERGASKFEAHIRNFLTPKVQPEAVEAQKVEISGIPVTFEGEELIVDPETKKVYTADGGEYIGDVGKLSFKDLEIPEYED